MTEKTNFLTQQSLDKFIAEHKDLKLRKIPSIADKINEAKAQGDLSENAEYHEAKEEMAWAQGRLMELQHIITSADIIDENNEVKDNVNIGSTVVTELNGNRFEFTIVGAQEANPFNGKISNESPLGEAIIGGAVNDNVEVVTPSGTQNL